MWPCSEMLDKPCIFILALSHAPPSIFLRTDNPRTPAELLRRSDVITPGCVGALWYVIGLNDSSGLDCYGPRWIFIGRAERIPMPLTLPAGSVPAAVISRRPGASGTPSWLAPPPRRQPATPPVALMASPAQLGTSLPPARRQPADQTGRKRSTPPPSHTASPARHAESAALPGPTTGSAAAPSAVNENSHDFVTNNDVCMNVTRSFASVLAALTQLQAQTADWRRQAAVSMAKVDGMAAGL